ncbi:unnamed protein product [Meloidogyne enterolobii]|uniref:Uncharacterized protein n=1 Tax=Meloidogyne enterolobii TaxID=390850 RepID=A0ACB0YHR3_MELEN
MIQLTPDEFAIIRPHRNNEYHNYYHIYSLYYASDIDQNLKSKIEEHYINPQLIAENYFTYDPDNTAMRKIIQHGITITIPSIHRWVNIPGGPEIGESSQQAGEGTGQQAGEGTGQQAVEGTGQQAGEETSQQAAESNSTGASRRRRRNGNGNGNVNGDGNGNRSGRRPRRGRGNGNGEGGK